MLDNINRVRVGDSPGEDQLSSAGLKKRQKLFKAFYQLHYEISYRYLRAREFSAENIADILANTFETAWKNFGHYLEIPANLPQSQYWLLGILKNATRSIKRRDSREAQLNIPIDTTGYSDSLAAQGPTPEEILLQKEQASAFARIIRTLPEKYRLIVSLRLEGFDYKQIAKLLEISVAAAEIRMRRALLKLKKPLEDFMGDLHDK
jgi:RNA polymerase sigma-70 factor, ECF subfamily